MANDPRIPNVSEIDSLAPVPDSQVEGGKIAVKSSNTGETQRLLVRQILSKATAVTIGDAFPANPATGSIHYFSRHVTGLTWKSESGGNLTEAYEGNVGRYDGTDWVFIYNFRSLIEALIFHFSTKVGFIVSLPTNPLNNDVYVLLLDVDEITDGTLVGKRNDVWQYFTSPSPTWLKLGSIGGSTAGETFTTALKNKLDGIEPQAKDDQTGVEIAALINALTPGTSIQWGSIDGRPTIPMDTTIFFGPYATTTAIPANNIVSYNNNLYWTNAAIPDTNTVAPDTNTDFEQIDAGGGPTDLVGLPTISNRVITFTLRNGTTGTITLDTPPISDNNFPSTDPTDGTLIFFNAAQSTFTTGKTVRNEADDADVTSATAGTSFKFSTTGSKWIRQYVPSAATGLTQDEVDTRIHLGVYDWAEVGDVTTIPQSKHARRVVVDLREAEFFGLAGAAQAYSLSGRTIGGVFRNGANVVESYREVHGKLYYWNVPADGAVCILADLLDVNNATDRAIVGGAEFHIANSGTGSIVFQIGGIGEVFPPLATIPPGGVAMLAIDAVGGPHGSGNRPAFRLITSPHDETENIADLTDEVNYLEENAPAHWHIDLDSISQASGGTTERQFTLHGFTNLIAAEDAEANLKIRGMITVDNSGGEDGDATITLTNGATQIFNQVVSLAGSASTAVHIPIDLDLSTTASDDFTLSIQPSLESSSYTMSVNNIAVSVLSHQPIYTDNTLEGKGVGSDRLRVNQDNLRKPFEGKSLGTFQRAGSLSEVSSSPNRYFSTNTHFDIANVNVANVNVRSMLTDIVAGQGIMVDGKIFIVASKVTTHSDRISFAGRWYRVGGNIVVDASAAGTQHELLHIEHNMNMHDYLDYDILDDHFATREYARPDWVELWSGTRSEDTTGPSHQVLNERPAQSFLEWREIIAIWGEEGSGSIPGPYFRGDGELDAVVLGESNPGGSAKIAYLDNTHFTYVKTDTGPTLTELYGCM